MIFHALKALSLVSRIDKIVVVLSAEDQHWQGFQRIFSILGPKIVASYVGGKSRGESVANALALIDADVSQNDWVLVHDAARPCIRTELIEQFIDELENDLVGGLLALPLADTIKLADENLRVAQTIPRDNIWRAQTPQMFRFGLLQPALQRLINATDEAQAIEANGHQPKLVMGDSANLKITYAPDMDLARVLLNRKTES